jgi:uncharacterized protein YqjF (DUF2071 family)
VRVARRFFHLPYIHAEMGAEIIDESVHYRSRKLSEEEEARFVYPVITDGTAADVGSLEFFLIERYLLFSADRAGTIFSGQVWHEPYRIKLCSPQIWSSRPLSEAGFDPKDRPPVHSCVAAPVDVRVFGLQENQMVGTTA